MKKIRDGEVSWVVIDFYDKDGKKEAPVSATYKVQRWSGTDWVDIGVEADITPIAETVELKLTAEQNTLVDTTLVEEIHRVCVASTYGAADAKKSTYKYLVIPAEC